MKSTFSKFPHVFVLPLLAALVAVPTPSSADPATEAFFESRIRPALVKHCYECHSLESGESKGGLRLDTRESARRGGNEGPAVVPGDPAGSLLLVAIRHEDPDLEMPPRNERLPDQVARDFEQWILAGAIDPREEDPTVREGVIEDMEKRLEFWSYGKPERPKTPAVEAEDWPEGPVDRFVLARLEENGLAPAPPADPSVLLRRLYFDLTGLPPVPEEVAAFSMENLERTVDSLLSSEGFAIRWARHWLDVARFAESNGKESNLSYPHAWRYRDYVIDAIRNEIPYDRFLLEQVAGDLLPADSDEERARLLIATGFLAVGAKGLNEQDDAQFAADLVDEQLDALTRGVMANSVACARCHDHKSEPYTMEDYYAMAGIFQSTQTYYGTWIDSENNNGGELIRLPDLPGQLIPNQPIAKEEVDRLKKERAELDEKERKGREYAEKARAEGIDLREQFNEILREALRIYWTRGRIDGRLATVDDEGNPLPLAMGAMDREEPVESAVYHRGELAQPLHTVPRGVPTGLALAGTPEFPTDASGRLELAQWLIHPDHPLTARVMVNRIWKHLFGTGLVRTVDDFSVTGEAPSHPELLDYLAVRFQESGWSIKEIIREIVLSQAYRQDSGYRADAFQKDPDNRLLWRMNQRRLEAEALRDAMLSISGQLDQSPRPGSLVAELNGQAISLVAFNRNLPDDLDGSFHRSIYLPVLRENLPDVLDLFDFAEPSLVTGDRDVTNVPMQALFLMNSSFVEERATAFAKRLEKEEGDPEARIARAFELAFGRGPDETEQAIAQEFLHRNGEQSREEGDALDSLVDFCQALFSSAEFSLVY